MADETPSIGVLMFVAYRAIEQEVYDTLRAEGYTATLAQGRIAARITEHGNRVTELADSAQVTKQTASVLVDQLEALGYVERVPDPTDARARLVRLAPRGREAQVAAGGWKRGCTRAGPSTSASAASPSSSDSWPGSGRSPTRTHPKRSEKSRPHPVGSRFRVRGRVKKPATERTPT